MFECNLLQTKKGGARQRHSLKMQSSKPRETIINSEKAYKTVAFQKSQTLLYALGSSTLKWDTITLLHLSRDLLRSTGD